MRGRVGEEVNFVKCAIFHNPRLEKLKKLTQNSLVLNLPNMKSIPPTRVMATCRGTSFRFLDKLSFQKNQGVQYRYKSIVILSNLQQISHLNPKLSIPQTRPPTTRIALPTAVKAMSTLRNRVFPRAFKWTYSSDEHPM